jgi:hypothetical protein
LALAAAASGDARTVAGGTAIGRYRVVELLGSGGMGVVYAADDPQLRRRIALKVIRSDGGASADSDELAARLLREAQTMAQLAHPNVVAVHDAGAISGQVFIAMELVAGLTLRKWLVSEARSWREVVDIFLAAGAGLAAAHAKCVVHRDFKLENVLVGTDGRARVTDFGLARPIARLENSTIDLTVPAVSADPGLRAARTRSGALVGTPSYMAPELFRGQAADPKSDQFAFCVALYEGLFGVRPFAADTVDALVAAVTAGRVVPAPRRSRVPTAVRKILFRGLDADPARRFASMDSLLERLARARRGEGERRHLVAFGVAFVALAAGAAFIAWPREPGSRTAPPRMAAPGPAPATPPAAALAPAAAPPLTAPAAPAALVAPAAPVAGERESPPPPPRPARRSARHRRRPEPVHPSPPTAVDQSSHHALIADPWKQ